MKNDRLDFLVAKDNLRKTKSENLPAIQVSDLSPGQISVYINRFGLTANNVTYAAFGKKLSYWDFFPAGDAAWGHLPVWGFAHVLDSRNEGIKEGEALFGYWPAGNYFILSPEKISARGFTDGAPHRSALPQVYNQYVRVSGEPDHKKEDEDKETIFRPLFITSFFLDDYLFDNKFFDARQIVIASASSKTAISLAYLLTERRSSQFEIIGLTSPANLDFVKSLNTYDRVVSYDSLKDIKANIATAFVDMAGSEKILKAAHEHFNSNLKASISVGASHWENLAEPTNLPGPKPEFFFAPSQIRKRSTEWGPGGVEEKFAYVWPGFLQWLDSWFEIEEFKGEAGLSRAYEAVLAGKAAPQRGFVVAM